MIIINFILFHILCCILTTFVAMQLVYLNIQLFSQIWIFWENLLLSRYDNFVAH